MTFALSLALGALASAAPPAAPKPSPPSNATPAPQAAELQAQLEAIAEADKEQPYGFDAFMAELQYEVFASTTLRFQADNGDQSGFFNAVEGNLQTCRTSADCPGTAVCFPSTPTLRGAAVAAVGGVCRTRNQQFDPTGEDFGDFLTTFGGSIRWRQLVATARLDAALYFFPPVASPNASGFIVERLRERYENQLQPEYLSLAYSSKNVEVTLGDYYVTLGRGLALGIRIVDDVAVDNKLRGAEAKAHAGPLDLHIFYGLLNIKNFEPGTGFAFEDTEDQIGGGRVEWNFGRALKVGAHVARIRTPVIDNNQTEFLNSGVTMEMPRPADWLSFYAEAVHMQRDRSLSGGRQRLSQDALGLYANMNLYFGPVTFLAEGKIYDNLFNILPGDATDPLAQLRQNINRLSEPPTAERFGATILTNSTVYGGRGRIDWAINPKVVPYVSYGHYVDGGCGLFGFRGRGASIDPNTECDDRDGPGENVVGRAYINAIFGGVRARWDDGDISVETGYRSEFFFSNQTTDVDKLRQEENHTQIDFHQRLPPFNIEMFILRKDLAQIGNAWTEVRAALTLSHRDGWSLTGAYEQTTISPNAREHYPSLSGQWQIAPEVLVRGLVGGERPGLKCSGGACRQFPGFEGARLETVVRF